MSNDVRDNSKLHRFELNTDGHIAFSEYKRADGLLTIMHTEVPKELGGRGIGSALIRGENDFTADIVMTDGRPSAKVGRRYRENPRLELVE